MKRFLVIGAVFCVAAVVGLALVAIMPSTANAGHCNEQERQTWYECDSPICRTSIEPHAKWDCGTEKGGGHEPCNCKLVHCYSDPC
jgi:hypothetical protein